ncbi:rho GTPase-activating protein 12-like isoform X1 [Saccostrea echinata]|uniref:rho GTPase-activating protein 12-like isoform X1 n=1 Tax=Saccostrea echinata TaxID=191078 RepID=UPI002A82078A|nr:rho GTPase-activating protein 12-like isoform X1 [Saccostrea echinata]
MSFDLGNTGSDEEEYDPYSMMPVTKLVALYDYSYQDDDGHIVHMKEGEKYHLIQKEGDWWEVIRDMGNLDDLSFYVPANYVRVVDNSGSNVDATTKTDDSGLERDEEIRSGNSTLDEDSSDLSSAQVTPEKNVGKTENGVVGLNSKMEELGSEVTFERKQSTTFSTFGTQTTGSINLNTKIAENKGYRRSFSDEGDYVNLDEYRLNAGLNSERRDGTQERIQEDLYANVTEIHSGDTIKTPDSPPPSTEGNYLKTLLGVWDSFLDPVTKRIYYVNRETHERTYKPPRPADRQKQVEALNSRKVSLPEILVNNDTVPSGWRVEDSAAGKIFVNSATNEKWASKVNEDGQRYYFKIDGDESAWELPKIDEPSSPPPVGPPPTRSPSRSPRMARSVKAQSLIIGNKINFQPYMPTIHASAQIPKSQTLPANMSTPLIMESVSNDQRSATVAPQMQEGLSGTFKVAKVMEAGKPKKKSSNQNFVKLSGSNMVFYKDLRASKSQPGSPNGRPEFIVPLHGGMVEKHGKEKANKKYLKLTTSQGDQYILQFEDDIMMISWLTQIDKTIRSLGGSTDVTPPSPSQLRPEPEKLPKKKPSFKTSPSKESLTLVRKGSSNEEGSLERGKMRTKLFNFLKSRPTKESLEQKGIIKDAVFGAHLKQLCEREKGKIPKFVQKCVVAIEKKGLDHDGMYRISGNLAQIQKLRCQVDQDHYNLEDECWDIHVLTGSLKLFFRELKEPLFTFGVFDKFIPALGKEKNNDRLKAVRDLINTLPKYNYETLKFLLAHLCKVIEHSKENRMQVHSVAIVFGPTLIWPETVTPNLAANMIYQSRIVEYCLLEYRNIFR